MHQSISNLIARSKVSDIEWLEQRKKDDEEMRKKTSIFVTSILPKLDSAKAVHYKKWLRGYISNGGKPTHFYDYKMPANFYIPKSDIKMIDLYASMSINIIVGRGFKISGSLGHCSVFYMDNFVTQGIFIPVYSNTIV